MCLISPRDVPGGEDLIRPLGQICTLLKTDCGELELLSLLRIVASYFPIYQPPSAQDIPRYFEHNLLHRVRTS